jgi:ATP-dependent DNA helicase RecQ
MAATGRARSTVTHYLVDFIDQEGVSDCEAWLSTAEFEKIRAAVAKVRTEELRPIFDAIGGQIEYEKIRIALACMRNDGVPQQTLP